MTRVKPELRKRAKTPKVRSGCKSCKVRRVKCDETKPYCLRCSSTGRRCGGYDSALTCSSASSSTLSSSRTTPLPHKSPTSLSIVKPRSELYVDTRDARSYQFFQEKTVHQMAELFPNTFWNEIIFQIAQREPTVRHAIISLSSFHENFLHTEEIEKTGWPAPAGEEPVYAVNQYSIALRGMSRSLGTTVEVHAISCLLFIAIEVSGCERLPIYMSSNTFQAIRGRIASAVQLFKHGRRVWREMHSSPGPHASHSSISKHVHLEDGATDYIEKAFSRLAIQVSEVSAMLTYSSCISMC